MASNIAIMTVILVAAFIAASLLQRYVPQISNQIGINQPQLGCPRGDCGGPNPKTTITTTELGGNHGTSLTLEGRWQEVSISDPLSPAWMKTNFPKTKAVLIGYNTNAQLTKEYHDAGYVVYTIFAIRDHSKDQGPNYFHNHLSEIIPAFQTYARAGNDFLIIDEEIGFSGMSGPDFNTVQAAVKAINPNAKVGPVEGGSGVGWVFQNFLASGGHPDFVEGECYDTSGPPSISVSVPVGYWITGPGNQWGVGNCFNNLANIYNIAFHVNMVPPGDKVNGWGPNIQAVNSLSMPDICKSDGSHQNTLGKCDVFCGADATCKSLSLPRVVIQFQTDVDTTTGCPGFSSFSDCVNAFLNSPIPGVDGIILSPRHDDSVLTPLINRAHSLGFTVGTWGEYPTISGRMGEATRAAKIGFDFLEEDEQTGRGMTAPEFNGIKSAVKAINPNFVIGITEPGISTVSSFYAAGGNPDFIAGEAYSGSSLSSYISMANSHNAKAAFWLSAAGPGGISSDTTSQSCSVYNSGASIFYFNGVTYLNTIKSVLPSCNVPTITPTTTSTTSTITTETSQTTTSTTTTTIVSNQSFTGSDFNCSTINGGYLCNMTVSNNLGENAVVVFLQISADGSIVNTPSAIVSQGNSTAGAIFFCSGYPSSYIAWKAFRQSDSSLSNSVNSSKSNEGQSIAC